MDPFRIFLKRFSLSRLWAEGLVWPSPKNGSTIAWNRFVFTAEHEWTISCTQNKINSSKRYGANTTEFGVWYGFNVILCSKMDEQMSIESKWAREASTEGPSSRAIGGLRIERDYCVSSSHREDRTLKQVYKTFMMHNLEDSSSERDKTRTLTFLLNLRDNELFWRAVDDLATHISRRIVTGLALFKGW